MFQFWVPPQETCNGRLSIGSHSQKIAHPKKAAAI
jgi:hypothetical protein